MCSGFETQFSATSTTDFYSVENYLVSKEVIDLLLANEFHCHSEPELRHHICDVFESVYEQFLTATEAINLRIFASKIFGIDMTAHILDRVNSLAEVSLTRVCPLATASEAIIKLQVEPNDAQLAEARKRLKDLDPKTRYRGKFAYCFFCKWLDLLVNDYKQEQPEIFSQIDRSNNVRENELVMSNFAARARPPSALSGFLAAAFGGLKTA